MINKIKNNPIAFFLLKAFSLLLLWYVLYELWLDPADILDKPLIQNLGWLSAIVLKSIGYKTIDTTVDHMRIIGIDGTTGLWVGDPCNGATIFAIFSIIIGCYPGPVKHKLWFIPTGFAVIHILNVIRIVGLSIVTLKYPEYLDFNHTYTFTILVYAAVFALWMIWINKFSKKNS